MRAHLTVVAIAIAAIAATAGFFAFARPQYHASIAPAPPNDLPYTTVTYRAAETQLAFARHGIRLTLRSRLPAMTDLSTADTSIEVTVFGDPATVRAMGSMDYTLDEHGRFVRYTRSCAGGVHAAGLWRGNVRAVVRCGPAAAAAIRRVERALAAL